MAAISIQRALVQGLREMRARAVRFKGNGDGVMLLDREIRLAEERLAELEARTEARRHAVATSPVVALHRAAA